MLKRTAQLLLFCIIMFVSTSSAKQVDGSAGRDIEIVLDKVDEVSFYFLSMTGNYSIRGEDFKKSAAVHIYRRCGRNCRNFMKEVVAHFQSAHKSDCQPGQQDVLIQIGNNYSVIYSYSGRQIQIGDECFFNKQGIREIVEKAKFLFG